MTRVKRLLWSGSLALSPFLLPAADAGLKEAVDNERKSADQANNNTPVGDSNDPVSLHA